LLYWQKIVLGILDFLLAHAKSRREKIRRKIENLEGKERNFFFS